MEEEPKRMNWRRFTQWPVFYRIFMGVVALVVISLLIVMSVGSRAVRTQLTGALRDTLVQRATAEMDKVVSILSEQIALIRGLTLNDDFVDAAVAANVAYGEHHVTELLNADATWRAASDDSSVVQAIVSPVNNATTGKLLDYVERFPYPVTLMLTDRYGGVVAATRRPTLYDHGNVSWWQAAYAGGEGTVHITRSEVDETGAQVLIIAAPLFADDGDECVGIVQGVFEMTPIKQIVDGVRFGVGAGMSGALLADAAGNVVTGWAVPLPDADSDASWFQFEFSRLRNGWYETSFADGTRAVVGHAFIADASTFNADDEAAIASLDWILFVYREMRYLYRPVTDAVWLNFGVTVALVVLSLVVARFIARSASVPIGQLKTVLEQEAAGDTNVRAWVYAGEEMGAIAEGINRLLDEKAALNQIVSERAAERAREQARRERDLEVTASVGEVTSATLDTDALIQQAVDLIRDSFNLYFVGLFLVNASRTRAVLHAGTGEAGRALLDRGYQVHIGDQIIGECVLDGESRVDCSVDRSEDVELPELPYARSEVALPLRSRGELLGALWALSYHAETFDDETLIVLQTIADQIAVAIDSIRLYAERQQAMRRLERASGEASREAWEELLQARNTLGAGYESRLRETTRLDPAAPVTWRPEAQRAWREGRAIQASDAIRSGERYLALPITSREGVIGVIDISKPSAEGDWTPDEIAQLEALTFQLGLALENARLYEDAQSRALRERLTSDASSHIRSSLNVDDVLQTAVREMRAVLGLEEAELRIGVNLISTEASGEEQHDI